MTSVKLLAAYLIIIKWDTIIDLSKLNYTPQYLVDEDLRNLPQKNIATIASLSDLSRLFGKLFDITYIRPNETKQRRGIVSIVSFILPSVGYPIINFNLFDEGYTYLMQLGRYDNYTPTYTYGWCIRIAKRQ